MSSGGVDKVLASTSKEKVPSLFSQEGVGIQWLCLVWCLITYSGKVFVYDLLSELTASFAGLWRLIVNVSFVMGAFVVTASVWQGMQPQPRHVLHYTPGQFVRTILQFFGDFLLAPYYALTPAEKPLMGYQETPENEKILSRCPALDSFCQTPWLRNPLASFGVLMYGDFMGVPSSKERQEKMIRRELLTTADGGVVSLDWWEEESQMELISKAKKVLLVGSTFTGDAFVTASRETCRYFTNKGWRCVVQVKRGCGLVNPNTQPQKEDGTYPKPWCLSGLEDMELAIDRVAELYPGLPICGLGLSTGGGQLRNYVGAKGKDSKLTACINVDAAPRWFWALDELDRGVPLIGKALGMAAMQTFKECGHTGKPRGESMSNNNPSGMIEFVRDWQAPHYGFEHSDAGVLEYMDWCQPSEYNDDTVPVLEMMTINDTLILPQMIVKLRQKYKTGKNVFTCVTVGGTHMVRWEGWKPSCWVCRAGNEFLESVLRSKQGGPHQATNGKKAKTKGGSPVKKRR